MLLHYTLLYDPLLRMYVDELSSVLLSATTDRRPSTEMEALTAAQQGMLHTVSLQTEY